MRPFFVSVCVLTLQILLVLSQSDRQSWASELFDVNDVSYLFPAPKTVDDVGKLISIDKIADEGAGVWIQKVFDELLTTSTRLTVVDPNGPPRVIGNRPSFHTIANWKIAGIRIDPSAPGADPAVQRQSRLGVMPQIRLIVQPVTISDTKVAVHDVAVHMVFSFDRSANPREAAEPAQKNASFEPVVAELQAIKAGLNATGIKTAGPLGVHPGFQTADFASTLLGFLKKFATEKRLGQVAFMGIVDRAEPWIFFPMAKDGAGQLQLAAQPQMLSFRNSTFVLPPPVAATFGSVGVSTASLFESVVKLDDRVFPDSTDERLKRVRFSDVPDIIANPQVSHFFNTDCISCHTESNRRTELGVAPESSEFHYSRPDNISGPDPLLVPSAQSEWNVRNFGWFPNLFSGAVSETVTFRTANEAAESTEFINRIYLSSNASPATITPSTPAAAPEDSRVSVVKGLTLVMTIKSKEDEQALRKFLATSQNLPPDKNPITVAMDKLGLVHDARFVFLNEKQLAVITTFDGDFEVYLHAFVEELGEIFDKLLKHMEDAPTLPVKDHPEELLEYVKKHDLKAFGTLYSAYPTLSVQDIRLMHKKAIETNQVVK